jgi:arylsulfatase A-like enzyme
MNRREFLQNIGLAAISAKAVTNLSVKKEAVMTDKKPNVLFIMTDHQRADSIGMIQSGIEVTPNINQLAAQSVVFSRAYNTCPLCVPARTALATGKYPTENGVVFNDWKGARAQDHKPIHQYLAETGYHVGHVGVHHIRLKPELQERLHFSKWISNGDYSRYLKELGVDETPLEGRNFFKKEVVENQNGESVKTMYSNSKVALWGYNAEHFKDSYFCKQGIDFINNTEKPFALFVCLWAPHPPLRVPEPYASLFDPEALKLPSNVGLPAEGEPQNRRRGIAGQLAEGVSMDEWRKAWAAHLGLTNLADAGIGLILQALKESGELDNTIIVFTVDHGDHLGQHRMYQKMEMYEQAIRIPMIIHTPDADTGVIDDPVSHLDIMPTLMDMIGLEIPSDLDGISLADAVKSGDSLPDRFIFSQYSGNPTVGDIRRAVVTRKYKYIYDPNDIPELYDLENDPLEMHNLAADGNYRPILRELHEKCKSWGEQHKDWIDFSNS